MYRFDYIKSGTVCTIIVDDSDIERKSDYDIGLKNELIRVFSENESIKITYGCYFIKHSHGYSYKIKNKYK